MNSEKVQALKALDVAMDTMMIDYAKKFSSKPDTATLEILYKLIDVDEYVDKFLEESGEKPKNMYTGMNQALHPTNTQANVAAGAVNPNIPKQ